MACAGYYGAAGSAIEFNIQNQTQSIVAQDTGVNSSTPSPVNLGYEVNDGLYDPNANPAGLVMDGSESWDSTVTGGHISVGNSSGTYKEAEGSSYNIGTPGAMIIGQTGGGASLAPVKGDFSLLRGTPEVKDHLQVSFAGTSHSMRPNEGGEYLSCGSDFETALGYKAPQYLMCLSAFSEAKNQTPGGAGDTPKNEFTWALPNTSYSGALQPPF